MTALGGLRGWTALPNGEWRNDRRCSCCYSSTRGTTLTDTSVRLCSEVPRTRWPRYQRRAISPKPTTKLTGSENSAPRVSQLLSPRSFRHAHHFKIGFNIRALISPPTTASRYTRLDLGSLCGWTWCTIQGFERVISALNLLGSNIGVRSFVGHYTPGWRYRSRQ